MAQNKLGMKGLISSRQSRIVSFNIDTSSIMFSFNIVKSSIMFAFNIVTSSIIFSFIIVTSSIILKSALVFGKDLYYYSNEGSLVRELRL